MKNKSAYKYFVENNINDLLMAHLSLSSRREGPVFIVRCRSVMSSSKREEEGCHPGTKQPLELDHVGGLHPIRSRKTVLSQQKQSIWAPAVSCSPTSKVRSEMS